MKKHFSAILGSIIIGLCYSVFFLPYNLITTSTLGISEIIHYESAINPAVIVVIINTIMLLIGIITLGYENSKKYILTSILVPLSIYIGTKFNYIVDLKDVDLIILVMSGSYLTGYGYSLIYKTGLNIGGFSILDDIINSYRKNKNKEFEYIIEIIVVLLTFLTINFEMAVYSIIIIFLINYMATKSKIGISNSKTFYIITTKEEDVKEYLLKELKVDFTEFNVKGGYSNNKNKIIMTVIDTKDYYKLKEGVSIIDSNAFIFIIDNYETINQNVTITKKMKDSNK